MPILNFFGQPVKENEQPKKGEEEENKNKCVEDKSEEEVDEEEWIDASAPNDDDETEKTADNKDTQQEKQEKQEKQEQQQEQATATPAAEPQPQQQQTPQNENENQEAQQQQQQQQLPPFRLHPIQLGVLVGLLLTRHYKIFSFATLLIFHPVVIQTINSCFEGHEETLEKAKRAICNVAEKMKQKYDLMKGRVKVAIAGLKGNNIQEDNDIQNRTELKKRRRIVVACIVLVVFVIVIANCFLVVLARERNALHAELQQLKTTPQAIEKELIRYKLENQHLLESNYNLAHEKLECQSGLGRCQRDLEEEKKTHKQEVEKIINEMKTELKKQKNGNEMEKHATINTEQKENTDKNQQQTQSSSPSNSNSNNCGPYKRRCGESFKEKLMKRRQEAKKQQQQRDMKMNTNDKNNNKNKKKKFQPLTALGEFLNPFFEWQLDFEL